MCGERDVAGRGGVIVEAEPSDAEVDELIDQAVLGMPAVGGGLLLSELGDAGAPGQRRSEGQRSSAAAGCDDVMGPAVEVDAAPEPAEAEPAGGGAVKRPGQG